MPKHCDIRQYAERACLRTYRTFRYKDQIPHPGSYSQLKNAAQSDSVEVKKALSKLRHLTATESLPGRLSCAASVETADLKVKEIKRRGVCRCGKRGKRSGNGACPSSDTGQDRQAPLVPEEYVLGHSFQSVSPVSQMAGGPLRRISH